MIQFTPVRKFYSGALHSVYLPGYTYTVRPGDDRLRALLDEWLENGSVQIIVPGSRIAGQGAVSG